MIPPMTVQLYKALRDICRGISRSDEPGAICIIYEDCYRKISQGNSIRGRIRYCFPVFCVKIKFYREVCKSKLLAISVWRFIINIHDIRITTAVFTVQWFNDIR